MAGPIILSSILSIFCAFFLTACGSLAVVKDTGIVAGGAALGSLVSPVGAAVGAGASYMGIRTYKGDKLADDVQNAALTNGAIKTHTTDFILEYGIWLLLLAVFFVHPNRVLGLFGRVIRWLKNLAKE